MSLILLFIQYICYSFLDAMNSSPTQNQNSPNGGNQENLFDLLDNQFVEPLNENDTINYQDRTNQLINEQNAAVNRLNDLKNEDNSTKESPTMGNTTDIDYTDNATDPETTTPFLNLSSTATSFVKVTSITPVITSKYDYKLVLHKSLLFYEAQRSGKLPDNKRLNWTISSALSDRGTNGQDLSGKVRLVLFLPNTGFAFIMHLFSYALVLCYSNSTSHELAMASPQLTDCRQHSYELNEMLCGFMALYNY